MHIEPGFLVQAKIMFANVAAAGLLSGYAKELIKKPADIVRTLLAALFFSLFMQSFHMPVGPSELHFVGAMVIYMTLGFVPTLFGFAVGLTLQALLFNPADMMHLAVNSLSLILPLIALHMSVGRKLRKEGLSIRWQTIVKLDAIFYAGVTAMVGFWLLIGEVATPFTAWATFASSYLVIVAIEPLITFALLRLLKQYQDNALVSACFAIKDLNLAK